MGREFRFLLSPLREVLSVPFPCILFFQFYSPGYSAGQLGFFWTSQISPFFSPDVHGPHAPPSLSSVRSHIAGGMSALPLFFVSSSPL